MVWPKRCIRPSSSVKAFAAKEVLDEVRESLTAKSSLGSRSGGKYSSASVIFMTPFESMEAESSDASTDRSGEGIPFAVGGGDAWATLVSGYSSSNLLIIRC